jgi:hypothetical protein
MSGGAIAQKEKARILRPELSPEDQRDDDYALS